MINTRVVAEMMSNDPLCLQKAQIRMPALQVDHILTLLSVSIPHITSRDVISRSPTDLSS